ncbi:MAG: hypothetical protein MUC50_17695, partial [Myxococcota bacterium]|nr:hypothetical protein [Myxococcota bacterium]
MRAFLPVTMALMFATFAFGCEEAGNEPGIGGIEQGAEPQVLPAGSASGYYSLTRDMRKCMYPMCGGYYLTAVNQTRMRCVDGSLQKSCYVADADFSAIKLPGSDFDALFSRVNSKLVVFHGTVESNVIEGRGDYGRLVADKVYSAVTDKLPGTYEPIYFAMDNGIRCIKAPCLSIDDVKVNTNSAPRSVMDVDFSGVQGATQEQRDAASMALYEAGVLVAGYHE